MFVLFVDIFTMRRREILSTASSLVLPLKSFLIIGVVLFVVLIRACLKNLSEFFSTLVFPHELVSVWELSSSNNFL